MKRRMRMALAIAIAVLLSVFAIAEEIADVALEADGLGQEAADIELSGADDFEMDAVDGDALVLDGLEIGDFPTLDSAEYVVAYRFLVDGETYALQEAHDGEAIDRPEDPTAPEGMAFAGWRLEDGSPLFVDADGDGQDDPVVARADAPYSEVTVLAEFVKVSAGEEAPAEEEIPIGDETPSEADAPGEEETPAGEAAPIGDEAPDEDEIPEDEEVPAGEAAAEPPTPNALVYTGEAQPLVSAAGDWRYSLDGESYTDAIPTAVNAGEYTVYYKASDDAGAHSLTVVIAKADVTFTPPVAATGVE